MVPEAGDDDGLTRLPVVVHDLEDSGEGAAAASTDMRDLHEPMTEKTTQAEAI
ncbi:hypothetical protein GCM10027059_47970 [Myceligenerans halotolerans]